MINQLMQSDEFKLTNFEWSEKRGSLHFTLPNSIMFVSKKGNGNL